MTTQIGPLTAQKDEYRVRIGYFHPMQFLRNRPYFTVALIVVPLLAMITTTPIFLVINQNIQLLPIIWLAASGLLAFAWLLNYYFFRILQGRLLLLWTITTLIMIAMDLIPRLCFQQDVESFLVVHANPWLKSPPPPFMSMGVVILNNTLILVFQTLVRYRLQQVQMINDLSEAKLHRMQAQYVNLRNHIHPHFLFNALNTLKILIHKDPDQAEAYILKVSEFLRSSLQSTHRAKLPVADDLRIAVNYLQIQEVRFKNCFELHIEMDQIASSKGLPMLAIQSLFENILKHNRLSKAEPIHIWVKTEGTNCLVITNTRIPLESERMESTGTGLFNLSERFKLLGGQPIEIQETPLAFVVKMYYLDL